MQVAQGQGLVRGCALVQAAIGNEHVLQLALCGGGFIYMWW